MLEREAKSHLHVLVYTSHLPSHLTSHLTSYILVGHVKIDGRFQSYENITFKKK